MGGGSGLLRTCASHAGGVFDGPVEAFVTVTDGGSLVMAGAVQRTLGAFTIPRVRLEGAGLTGCGDRERRQTSYARLLSHQQHTRTHTHLNQGPAASVLTCVERS